MRFGDLCELKAESYVTDVGGARELIPDERYGWIVGSSDLVGSIPGVLDAVRSDRLSIASRSQRTLREVDEHCSWFGTAHCVISAF